jgi:hypothetical protein
MSGRASNGCGFWWKAQSCKRADLSDGAGAKRPTGQRGRFGNDQCTEAAPIGTVHHAPEEIMNSIIYIVGLVVVILLVLSFFGFR